MCGWDRDSSVCRSYQPSLVHDPTGVKDNLCQVRSEAQQIFSFKIFFYSGVDIQAEVDCQLWAEHPPLLLRWEKCLNTGEFSLSLLSQTFIIMTFDTMAFVIMSLCHNSHEQRPPMFKIQEAQVEWHHYSKTKGR